MTAGYGRKLCALLQQAEIDPIWASATFNMEGPQPEHAGLLPGPWGNYVWMPCADGKVRRAPDDSFSLVDGLHRSILGALGNSQVPQIAEIICRAIVKALTT